MLGISYQTARTHRSNLMRKLSIHNCAALTLYAATHLIIKDPRFAVLANVVELPRAGTTGKLHGSVIRSANAEAPENQAGCSMSESV